MASNLTRYDPIRDIAGFDPFRSIENFLQDFPIASALRRPDMQRHIRVDVDETDQAYTVKADMPGLQKDDINVAVDGNHVSISATVHEDKKEDAGGSVYSERYTGSMYRSFVLPQEVDDSATEAKYQDGVLYLTLPKKQEPARKRITVQ